MCDDTIERIYQNYLILKDSIRVTHRSVKKQIGVLHRRTIFETQTEDEFGQQMKPVHNELDDLIVLSLFAAFERMLRNEISEKMEILEKIIPRSLGDRLSGLIKDQIEYWKMQDVLEVFSFAVDKDTIGKLKQILEYRNWVAHGRNLSKLPSANTDPKTVCDEIRKFFRAVRQATDVGTDSVKSV